MPVDITPLIVILGFAFILGLSIIWSPSSSPTCDEKCGPVSAAEQEDCYNNGYYYTATYSHSRACQAKRKEQEANNS